MLQMKLVELELVAERLPTEVQEGSIEYSEAEDTYLPRLAEIRIEIDDLTSLVNRWNPTKAELENRRIAAEEALPSSAGVNIPHLKLVKPH